MFAVDGKQPCARSSGLAHERGTGADQTFLIREGYGASGGQCRERRWNTSGSGDCSHHNVGWTQSSLDDCRVAGRGLYS